MPSSIRIGGNRVELKLPAKVIEAKVYQAVKFGTRYLSSLNTKEKEQEDLEMYYMEDGTILIYNDSLLVIAGKNNIQSVRIAREALSVPLTEKPIRPSLKKKSV